MASVAINPSAVQPSTTARKKIGKGIRLSAFERRKFFPYPDEPYRVESDDIAKMRSLGWEVTVHPDLALHHPGHTVAVWVHEPTTRSRS